MNVVTDLNAVVPWWPVQPGQQRWNCLVCGYHGWKDLVCAGCHSQKATFVTDYDGMKSWRCPDCEAVNLGSGDECYKCYLPRGFQRCRGPCEQIRPVGTRCMTCLNVPKGHWGPGVTIPEFTPDMWECLDCRRMNHNDPFPRPSREMENVRPGPDCHSCGSPRGLWICPAKKCRNWNPTRYRKVCKCGTGPRSVEEMLAKGPAVKLLDFPPAMMPWFAEWDERVGKPMRAKLEAKRKQKEALLLEQKKQREALLREEKRKKMAESLRVRNLKGKMRTSCAETCRNQKASPQPPPATVVVRLSNPDREAIIGMLTKSNPRAVSEMRAAIAHYNQRASFFAGRPECQKGLDNAYDECLAIAEKYSYLPELAQMLPVKKRLSGGGEFSGAFSAMSISAWNHAKR